jgi:cell pole-organizing protein PopZ
MAQLSSAQREPSMEEILASIRRIIEDSDMIQGDHAAEVVRADNDEVPPGVVAPALNGRVPPAPPVADVIEVDAFRAELRNSQPPQPQAQPRDPEAFRSAISLADVQAQVAADQIAARAAAERAYHDASPVSEAAPVAATSPAPMQPRREQVVASIPSRSVEPIEWNLDTVLLAKELSSLTSSDDEHGYEPKMESVAEPVAASSPPVEVAQQQDVVTALQPLISDQAGKQVKAAFGELSEAFAARSKRSLDDLAAEMLRPMLQDWLDNNLPLLVEKLVREEIERVARGS